MNNQGSEAAGALPVLCSRPDVVRAMDQLQACFRHSSAAFRLTSKRSHGAMDRTIERWLIRTLHLVEKSIPRFRVDYLRRLRVMGTTRLVRRLSGDIGRSAP